MALVTKREMESIYKTFQLIKKKMEADGFHMTEIGLNSINQTIEVSSISPYKVKYEWNFMTDPLYLYMGTDTDGYLEYATLRSILANSMNVADWLYHPTSSRWHNMKKEKGHIPSITFMMNDVYNLIQNLPISDDTEILLEGSSILPDCKGGQKISFYECLKTHD